MTSLETKETRVEIEKTIRKADFVLHLSGWDTKIVVAYNVAQTLGYGDGGWHIEALSRGLKVAYFRGLNPTTLDFVILRRHENNDENPIEWWEEVDSLTYDQVVDIVAGQKPYFAPLHREGEEIVDLAETRAAEIAVEEAERKLETLRMCC